MSTDHTQYRRMVYTDPDGTKLPWVERFNGKLYLWNPPGGGIFEPKINPKTGADDIARVSDAVGKNFNDVPQDMVTHHLMGGATATRYKKMGGSAQIPFKAQEILLENLDRQADILRTDRDAAKKEAVEFKRKGEEALANQKEVYERTIASLEAKLRENQMVTPNTPTVPDATGGAAQGSKVGGTRRVE